MGESRQELVQWLNDLLQLNLNKVEQCGTGIYVDIPMSRVKFNANTEYGYIQNFKILQNCFSRHQIDKTVPVEQLIKCKMQDNLEFLQWTKRFWDLNFPDHQYDAPARRKGGGTIPPVGPGANRAPSAASGPRRGVTPTAAGAGRVARAAAAPSPATLALQNEVASLKDIVAGLERERDFYFAKLRDIELLIQQAVELDPTIEQEEDGLVKQIQNILYSTEEGFEIPNEEAPLDDQETF